MSPQDNTGGRDHDRDNDDEIREPGNGNVVDCCDDNSVPPSR
jgi:hypothetical protein